MAVWTLTRRRLLQLALGLEWGFVTKDSTICTAGEGHSGR